jgi:hypothetical protein
MTRRGLLFGPLLVVLLPTGIGCKDAVTEPVRVEPGSPVDVINNLQASYVLRDIEQYARLLAPEFRFKFQPLDAQEIAKEFWSREEDLAGTEALFKATVVASISVDLIHGPEEDVEDPEFPTGTKRILINQTFLQVDETTGITWVVSDLQDLFFRPGDETLGEDRDRWFLTEWRDLPSTGAPTVGITAVLPATWGRLKAAYR